MGRPRLAAALASMSPGERRIALAALFQLDKAAALESMSRGERKAALASMPPGERKAALAALFLVDEAARIAMKSDTKIGTSQLQEAIRNHAPSVSAAEIAKYERIRKRFESGRDGKRDGGSSIGFQFPSRDDD